MNIKKMGLFIKTLRENQDLTQEELAKSIPISRQAVSKWERGLAVPDTVVLLKLSEIFNVSVNEILSGEKIEPNNQEKNDQVSLKLYDEKIKKIKTIKILSFVIISLILLFLIFYFINSYKKIKVYTITGIGNSVEISNGVFIRTNEKLFFRLGDLTVNDNEEIKSITLYYTDKNNINKIIKTNNNNVMFIDYYGYNEYFDTNKIDYIIKNLYVDVELLDKTESIKLSLEEDYVNDNIFRFREKEIGTKMPNNNKFDFDVQDKYFIDKIKSKYEKREDGYFMTLIDDKFIKYFYYNDSLNNISLTINTEDRILENWIYQINSNRLEYNNIEKEVTFIYEDDKFKCLTDNCEKENEIIQTFYSELLSSLK